MTTKRPADLTPLLEDSSQSPFMRELLEAGRDASVAGYDFERALSKHMALVETGAPMPHWAQGLRPVAGAGGAAAAGSSLLPWLAVPLALTALTSAVVLVSRQAPTQHVSTTAAPVPQAQGVQSAAAPVVAQPVNPTSTPNSLAARPTHTPAANVAIPAPVVRAPHAKRTEARAEPKARPMAPVAVALADDSANAKSATQPTGGELFETARPVAPATQSASAVVAATQPVTQPEQQAARPAAPPQPAPQDDARLEREMAMLAVAQRVLPNDPARALNLARQGESEFAGSMFTQERQQIVLLSLVKLGRMDEAKRLAKPYLARYPHGPFSDRVRLALATGKVDR